MFDTAEIPAKPAIGLQIPARISIKRQERTRIVPLILIPWLMIGFSGLILLAAALLWPIWTADATRSLGIYFPFVSIALILRAWRQVDWEVRGTWWGIVPLLAAVGMSRGGGNALQAFLVLPHHFVVTLFPLGLAVFFLGGGMILLLGGFGVFRRALFPLGLLLFVNPVPAWFKRIDLPLQYFCAHVARTFAAAIGVHPDGSQLSLMFAPGFGMFIAPGCNGLRGAVTLAYLALILGYVLRASIRARGLLTLGGLTLGYVFNLLRLCLLVLFYRLAMHFPSLQEKAKGADYLIGGLLFLSAAILLAAIVRWKKRQAKLREGGGLAKAASLSGPVSALHGKGITLAGLVVLLTLSCLPSLREIGRQQSWSDASLTKSIMPDQIGRYRLLRTWPESNWLNQVVYLWGAYSVPNDVDEVDLGFWVGPGVHHPMACHVTSGERPSWHDVKVLPAASGSRASFELDFYEDAKARSLEATTLCERGGCNEEVLRSSGGRFTLASLGALSFIPRPGSKPLPVLIRIESPELAAPAERTRSRMLREVRDFMSAADLDQWISFSELNKR